MTNCAQQLALLGRPRPRTCAVCGLGPCRPPPADSAYGSLIQALEQPAVTKDLPVDWRIIRVSRVGSDLVEVALERIINFDAQHDQIPGGGYSWPTIIGRGHGTASAVGDAVMLLGELMDVWGSDGSA